MASRLDRLFVLLETGSTPATRKAAAQQLGQVQRLHPHELPHLLSRVHQCLKAQAWETRIAAGQAVEAILTQVSPWDPTPFEGVKTENTNNLWKKKLRFDTFDVSQILSADAQFLMASEAKVFDRDTNAPNSDSTDAQTQRALVNKRLGLDIAEKIGIDTSEIISNEDLLEETLILTSSVKVEAAGSNSHFSFASRSNSMIETREYLSDSTESEQNLSSREINLAKRRARKQNRKEALLENSGDGNGSSNDAPESSKKLKRELSKDFSFMSAGNGEGENFYDKAVEDGQWPLTDWVEVLLSDLFNPVWEVRHGSATALREVIRLHGKGGGRFASTSEIEMETSHQEWLEDIALTLVCVLALDRFGDFLTDQVVAPVRETCSQCLGTVLTLLNPTRVTSLLNIFIRLLSQKSWEVRHGSLLAFKYLFAVRKDLVMDMLPIAFSSVFESLSDTVDDVCAAAASALIPVAEQLVEALPKETPLVVNVLWDSLADLDDLSSACNSIMGLLATLLTFSSARNNLRGLDILMPRLWPFLHHTSSSVRKSALLTLQKLAELDPSVEPMSTVPLQMTLRHTFQRALVEHIPEVLDLIPRVWSDLLKSSPMSTLLSAACPMIGTWLFLSMQHPRLALDPQFLVASTRVSNDVEKAAVEMNEPPQKVYMSGSADGDPRRIANTRFILAKMMGALTPYVVMPLPPGVLGEPPLECYVRVLLHHLSSRSALQRTFISLVISAWEKPNQCQNEIVTNGVTSPVNSLAALGTRLIECLNEAVYFDEIAMGFTKLQSECRDFIATLKHYKVPVDRDLDAPGLFSFDQVQKACGADMLGTIQQFVKKPKILETLLERRRIVFNMWLQTTSEFTALNTMTLGSLAGAVVSIFSLPAKLNPVVKPLMDSIRREENELFQKAAATHLCKLMNLIQTRQPCPIPKIIQNLTSFLCSDDDVTPPIDDKEGILSLNLMISPQMSETKKCPGKIEDPDEADQKKMLCIQRRGATYALTSIAQFFGVALPDKVGRLWDLTFGALESSESDEGNPEKLRNVIDALQILETISPYFHLELFQKIENQMGRTCKLLGHKVRAVRHMASRCLAVWASIMPQKVMPVVAKEIVPRLGISENEVMRRGAIEAVWCVVDRLGLELLPYIVLLVVPVLGRMSDQDESVRMLASLTFATLVRLMPLEGGVPDPPNLPADLLHQKIEQRQFLEQLLNPTKVPEYAITIPISAELRPYQQAGVNWLGFLNKYKLHGILCDDMGLGKTLQSICILGSDHLNRQEKYNQDQNSENSPLPSIVICPPTLTGHWVYEIEKFVSREYLNPLHYHGPPIERNKLKPKLASHNLVVASYDIVRNDVEFFSSIRWNYCILDEGHIIKNGKTKISKAIKQLNANHRLILSGTPIQNNVLELWSLFDFLMPGFLGSEKQFSARFARPILMARDPKSSPKDQEAGALAMESLHRQALPFLLRRLKEDVLKDLPPKITQDYYCELSPIQEQLYEDFARTRAHQSLRDTFSTADESTKHSHIFQALQYLRKVCNHPKLVLTPQHPKYSSVMNHLTHSKSVLSDIHHSAKLPALKQLLLDCGIGCNDTSNSEFVDVVNQHRALIFCQLKVMLDILENDLFRVHMPSVTYLRLDGSVPAGQRHSLVTRFNNDPSIDVLLLTTQVGGLGLNLTGADTVIFVEHDWNPMRDLQAMDRAHRIGQKKVVNVYRLITRGTLEEKIMGLQKFKLMTANTVISQDNSCIETMATDQLLDLFVLEDQKLSRETEKKEDVGGIVGAYKNVLESMPELWEDKLYEEEYDLSSFIKNLAK